MQMQTIELHFPSSSTLTVAGAVLVLSVWREFRKVHASDGLNRHHVLHHDVWVEDPENDGHYISRSSPGRVIVKFPELITAEGHLCNCHLRAWSSSSSFN